MYISRLHYEKASKTATLAQKSFLPTSILKPNAEDNAEKRNQDEATPREGSLESKTVQFAESLDMADRPDTVCPAAIVEEKSSQIVKNIYISGPAYEDEPENGRKSFWLNAESRSAAHHADVTENTLISYHL